jgi:hypothetical protein
MQFFLTTFLPSFMALILLDSCAPISRRSPIDQASRMKKVTDFSPIKKKIALLHFYNESPMGGDDLAVTATEEFRREISKSREFILDPEAEGLFGSSKEIYA